MSCSRLSRVAVIAASIVVLAVGVSLGQVPDPRDAPPPTFFAPPGDKPVAQETPLEAPGMRRQRTGALYPPPTFLAPPATRRNGRLIMQPQISPGNMPQVIWQGGNQPQEAIRPSDHWIGVQCGRVSEALRAQLGLDEKQGILVMNVVDESPAAEVGIEKYDVLTQAGDRKLTKAQDLIDEVDAVKDGKLSIELIRMGKKKKVEATPEKRPAFKALDDEPSDDEPTNDSEENWKDFFDHMQKWEPGEDGRPSMKFQFWRQPGTILPNKSKPAGKLPGNVKIQIRKEGDKPVEIEVVRGDETWNVNENRLNELPDDLRPHIERMLNRPHSPVDYWKFLPKDFKVPNPLEGREGMIEKRFEEMNRRIEQLPNPLEGREGMIEKRFEEMNGRLDKLREAIEDLRGKRREKAEKEPKAERKPKAPKPEASGAEA